MSNAATLNMMAKAGTDDAARAATLAKKKGTSTPELFDAPPPRPRRVAAIGTASALKVIEAAPKMAKQKPPEMAAMQGGKRENAGRKAIYGTEVMHTISFKGTREHREEFLAAGGGNWVRAGLDERIAFKAKGGK